MLNLFAPLLDFLKMNEIAVDNHVFRLHYKVTVMLLVVFCILVSSKEHFGEPIQCHVPMTAFSSSFINAFCWIQPTYTVDKLQHGNTKQVISQGIGQHVEGEDKVTHVNYYQWVGTMLLLQAILFYIPHCLWNCWEGGKVQVLCSGLCSPLGEPAWTSERKKSLVDYLSSKNSDVHNLYAFQFALCEILNLFNVLGQLYLLNSFFNGEFFEYGSSLVKFYTTKNIMNHNPMDQLFPKVTKCTFRKFGAAGGLQNYEAVCVLPLNVLNEKLFAVLWFWLIILAILSTLAMSYRTALILSPSLRSLILLASTRQIPRYQVRSLTSSLSFGGWFMLSQLSKNINPTIFPELLYELYLKQSSNHKQYKDKFADSP